MAPEAEATVAAATGRTEIVASGGGGHRRWSDLVGQAAGVDVVEEAADGDGVRDERMLPYPGNVVAKGADLVVRGAEGRQVGGAGGVPYSALQSCFIHGHGAPGVGDDEDPFDAEQVDAEDECGHRPVVGATARVAQDLRVAGTQT